MAVKTTEERVNVGPFLYDGEKYKDPINVIINGVKYSVPRGKVVSVPKVVATPFFHDSLFLSNETPTNSTPF